MPRIKFIEAPKGRQFKLDLGCGLSREDGFVGIDIVKSDAVDHVLDLRQTPWPIKDGVVDYIQAIYLLGYLSGPERVAFMDEAWRILKPGGQMKVIVARRDHVKSLADPYLQWPPIVENSFYFFNKGWREANKVPYAIQADFDFGYGLNFEPEFGVRVEEARNYAARHYNNVVLDLHVTLTARK